MALLSHRDAKAWCREAATTFGKENQIGRFPKESCPKGRDRTWPIIK